MVIPPDNDNHKQQSRVGSGALRRGSQKRSVCVDLVSIGSAFGQQDVFKLRFTQIVDPNRIKPQFGAH